MTLTHQSHSFTLTNIPGDLFVMNHHQHTYMSITHQSISLTSPDHLPCLTPIHHTHSSSSDISHPHSHTPTHMVIHKAISSHGIIISVGYGVITYQGLIMSFIGEVFRIHSINNTPTHGIVVNLYHNTTTHLTYPSRCTHPQS